MAPVTGLRLPISTAFTESAVNEAVDKRRNKNPPMRWNRYTVQPLLTVRVDVLRQHPKRSVLKPCTAASGHRCHLQLNRSAAGGLFPRADRSNAKKFCSQIVHFAVKSFSKGPPHLLKGFKCKNSA
jgi:hypothetical protein